MDFVLLLALLAFVLLALLASLCLRLLLKAERVGRIRARGALKMGPASVEGEFDARAD